MTTNTPGTAVAEAAWRELLASDRVSADLVAAAYAEPRLRRLLPRTGTWELHFSRCTEQRWTGDVPCVGPTAAGPDHTGPYYVEGPSRSRRIGVAGTAREAVARVVERLPPGRGPAFVGTPGELAAYEGGKGT
ncbi:DUF6193 family natural product biosynthesis protein [Streptomyces bikiniensis]|uniref:DUF6193 family natural product biosynthesis protein n=1 Tax=Streptomyces bikiniensis TaxID=1896 RepID=UPI000A974E11|nr:DUF6193 family natural product biosynthesis protein [Streptomyces bikiniensis]